MDIRAVAFDVNGTLIRIQTEDGDEQIFRSAAHFLAYQGIDLHRDQVRDLYFQTMKEQLRASPEEYPEFDAVGIWRSIIDAHMTDFARGLPAGSSGRCRCSWPRCPAASRAGGWACTRSCARCSTSCADATPSRWSPTRRAHTRAGELHKVGLLGYFGPVVVSGDHGYRKPDRRLFQFALDGMDVAAGNTLYVGNDMYRDIYGAREAGMTTVMFDSDQGTKAHPAVCPTTRSRDFRDLLQILGLPARP